MDIHDGYTIIGLIVSGTCLSLLRWYAGSFKDALIQAGISALWLGTLLILPMGHPTFAFIASLRVG